MVEVEADSVTEAYLKVGKNPGKYSNPKSWNSVGNAELTLGKYESPERAKDVLDEIAEKYSEFCGTNGGPLLTQPGYIQPMLFEPPKVYEMPPRAGEDPDVLK